MERNRVAPILATKLYIPPSSHNLVPRPRLTGRLDQGLRRKLTLISAPAGSGKTTLVSEWAGSYGQKLPGMRLAWLSLDEADSDPNRFLIYLSAALGLGEETIHILQSERVSAVEPILDGLLNEIATVPGLIILVLDDYHAIDSRSIDEAVSYVIEHQPPQLRLVITTREDPQLPLARLRARNQLTELRAADLRFTPEEAAGFLQAMGLHLMPQDAATLEERTEGWIAGLQLAALAMQSPAMAGPQAVSDFIQAFAGNHRYVMDYLLEEVLQRQSAPVRSFLLQTSILDRLTGPLCDAVTGQTGSSARLEALQRGNFFVIPLDDQRQAYRYHHLFAEVLQTYLAAELPGEVEELHLRASVWYERHGPAAGAVRHALAGKHFGRAADLIERAYPDMGRSRQETTLLGWLRAMPEAVVRERPVLCNLYAGTLLQTGQLDGVETWLRAAEAPAGKTAFANEEEYSRLPGAVAIHRAGYSLMQGDLDGTLKYARQAIALAPEDDPLRRGGAAVLQGLVFWTAGDLDAAQQMYAEGMVGLQCAGNLSDLMGCALALADIQIAQGRLREAMQTYEHALQLAAEAGTPALRGTADMYVGMSELYLEWNDLPAAARCLGVSQAQGEHTGLPQSRYRWRAAMARMRAAEGDVNGALDLLDEAERLYMGDFSPNVRPVAALKAHLHAAHGRLEEALGWVRERGLSVGDELSYLREYEHITLARILLACYRRDADGAVLQETGALLDRLFKAAEAGGRVRSVIEIRILRALVLQAQGDLDAALVALEPALALAEPEGYVRMFIDEGQPVKQILLKASAQNIQPAYTRKLMAAFETSYPTKAANETSVPISSAAILPTGGGSQAAIPGLVEPLSQRELEVLRLFRTELSGPEIARELMVALSTVRTHTKSIFSKLDVNNRRAAVKRSEELHLI